MKTLPPPPPARMPAPGPSSWAVRVAAMAGLAATITVLAVLFRHHPSEFGFLPRCPSAAVGLACAGCGSTRAVHFLLQGDLASAWRHNPLMLLVGVPFAAVAALATVRAAWTGRWPRSPLSPPAAARLGLALAVILLGWTVLRNLPGETFSVLRPPARAAG